MSMKNNWETAFKFYTLLLTYASSHTLNLEITKTQKSYNDDFETFKVSIVSNMWYRRVRRKFILPASKVVPSGGVFCEKKQNAEFYRYPVLQKSNYYRR